MTTSALITCERLLIGYRAPILPPIDVEVRAGRFLAVIGGNGSGKTTWFKTLLGLVPPRGGRVVRARADLRVAYVPQVASLDAILPVRARDVVLWGRLSGLGFLRRASRADREACARALAEAGAAELTERPYVELSEGQKQRVLFARMLVADAELLLLDEPTASMDPVAEREAYARLAALAHERGRAVVVISHALTAALRHADEILLLDRERQRVVLGDRETVLAAGAADDAA